jgi:phage baseplate assembly protein W
MDSGQLYGKGLGFPPRVGADGRVVWSAGEANVRESIRIILMTELGERLRLPGFGGGLRRFLFEPNTVSTRHLMSERIKKTLTEWEPRISVEDVSVEPDSGDDQSAVAVIKYNLIATQAREQISMNINFTGQ